MRRSITLVIAAVILISGFFISSILSHQRKPVGRRPLPQKQQTVSTMTVKTGSLRTELNLTGPLRALDQVEVYAEVSGVLLFTEKRFKPGNRFSRGEPLIRIDDSVYRNNLLAQKSGLLNQLTLLLPDLSIDFPESAGTWRSYLARFDLNKPLPPLPEAGSEKERYYIASRNVYSQFYNIQSMEATLAKYTIRAPYDGVVTASSINPGTLVRQGQKLGEFVSTSVYEVEAYADLDEVKHLSVGLAAILTCDDLPGEFMGTVSRVNELIDRSTQTVAVYITTKDSRLRNGLYMRARIESDPIEDAVRLPVGALVGESQVWTVSDSVLELSDINVAAVENGQAVIQGLADGTIVVVEAPDEARPGMKLPAAPPPGTGAERSKNNP
ncbi:MAG: efflux RND transporter periplasmic adaptor subunit [Candidatus Krumholzibacteriota bacterium]|nr:efflux RND transporter periplasmic adaptor subunit [Candidatus Krumholzibacteriota bacterium]